MEAWTTGPSVQAALRGKLRKRARDSGDPGEEAERLELGAGGTQRKSAACQLHWGGAASSRGRILALALWTPWEPHQCHCELDGSHGEEILATSV